MSPALALRVTSDPKQQLQELRSQMIGLLGPAMEHVSGRPVRKLTANEIEVVIALNGEIQTHERQLGIRRH